MATTVSPFRLDAAFVARYAPIEPKFGFDGVGKFVCTRTYSRVKADGESKEEWYEIVERVVNGTYTMQKNWILKSGIEWKEAKAQRSAQEMYDRMFNFKFLPPGRGLWAMGSPITEERGLNSALNNCLEGNEKFLTQEYGYKAFKDMLGKHVTVMTANGMWVETMVHCHGQQPLWRITLVWNSCTMHEKVIHATGDHIWFVQTGEEVRQVATKDLDSHMKLACGEDDTSLFYHHNDERNCWWVDSVEPTDLVEPVYCVTIPDEVQGVPTNNSFVLQGNILTHNCAFVSTRGIAKPGPERVKPFSFLMDCSMLGVGTGFDVKGAGSFMVHGLDLESPKQGYVIPDTREGWCKSVDLLLTACFEGQPDYDFDYSQIRDKGTPIKGFGGVASGPDPLKKLHDDIRGVCEKNRGSKISITSIVDIMNMIGVCVVAGNVRRCLPKGTIVHTAEGLIPIEEVKPGMMARTSSGFSPISELVHQGTQKLVTIHNQTGEFKCTAKHKIAVMSKPGSSPAYTWKMAKELMPGDHMVFVRDNTQSPMNNDETKSLTQLHKDFMNSCDDLALVQANYGWFGIPTCVKHGKVVEVDLVDHDGLIPMEVTCIESTGEEADTYDISVPGANEFVAGPGLLVHNTAEIVFGDPEDDEYVNLKNWAINPHRGAYGWTSNNSVFAHQGMDYTKTAAVTAANGEPGYAWLDNMKAYGRMNGQPDNKDWRAEGGNPCVPSDTVVMTDLGPKMVKDLIGNSFKAIVHGKKYDSHQGFFKTGTKEVFILETKEGHSVRITKNHKVLTTNGWVEAQDLKFDDLVVLNNQKDVSWEGKGNFEQGWLIGNLLGDGHFNEQKKTAILQYWGDEKLILFDFAKQFVENLGGDGRYHKQRTGCEVEERDTIMLQSKQLYDLAIELGVSPTKEKCIDRAILVTSSEFQKGFITGLFDADGSVQGNCQKGCSIRINSTRPHHLEIIQQMLLNFGINSKVYKDRNKTLQSLLPNGKGGHSYYDTKPLFELVVSIENMIVFMEKMPFLCPRKSKQLEENIQSYKRKLNKECYLAHFQGLHYDCIEDVYDCTVEDVHRFSANGIIVHNCLEQTLESYEMCCLVEVFPFNCDNKEDFLRTLKFSYMYAKTVTLGQTHWPETNRVMLRNRRIGNSLSGIAQFVSTHGLETLREWCEEGYAEIQKYDTIYSDWFCIPKSIKTTSIKPSGTVSLLAGATSGMHYPISQYYIRRVRVNANSKLLPPLRAAGYKIEPQLIAKAFDPETYKVTETEIDPTTFVIEFVVNAGEGIRAEHEISMWEQLALAAFMQRHWADNQVSCTIKFNQEREGKDIAHALNYYQYQLKGISFLPHSGHGYLQAPYEPIDRETYEATKAGYGVLDFNDAVELPKPDMYCENDTCEMRQ